MSRTALAALAAMSVVGLACSSSPRTSEIPPPRIDVLEPQEGSVLTSPTLVLSGRIDTPGAPLASAEYQVQGGDWAPLAVDEQGNFSATVAAPRAAGMMLSLKVRAANLAEKRSEKSVEVLVQNAGPTLEISSPVDGAILGPSAVDTVTFTGTSVDRVTQAPATITLDFHDGVGPRPLDNSAAGFSITVPLAEEDFVAHDVTLVATDARGNSTTATLRVYVDRVAPTLSVTAPAEGQKFARADFAQSDDLTGQFTAADGDPSPTVELDVGNGWQPVTGNGFVVPTSPTDDGVIYTLQLRATDRAGNITSVVRSFAVDRVAPVAAIDRAPGSRRHPPSVMVTIT
ncbi:MAG: hypothetical protein IRZ16_24205, partial [Myxococcaceae bacterium]|nr:hypothetical protein [Myxococcaceae bacterium]